jgi:DNA end-binding protein Ku
VRFHQLNGKTGTRIAQKRVDPSTGEEVNYEDLVKGYELTKESYVVITPEELDALDPEKSRTIDIEDFVDLADIDPVYYDHPYYLIPDKGAAKAYGLLLNAMRESGKVAIARVVLRTKENLVAIRPAPGDVLMMETMIFADEVVPPEDLDGLPDKDDLKASDRELKMAQQLIESLASEFEPARYHDEYREKVLELIEAKELKASERELQMAQQLIDSLSSDFEPEKYHDEYREKVLELIERKAAGEEIAVQPEAPQPAKVPDLMAALEASLAAVTGDADGEKPKKSGGKKPAREKAGAKK